MSWVSLPAKNKVKTPFFFETTTRTNINNHLQGFRTSLRTPLVRMPNCITQSWNMPSWSHKSMGTWCKQQYWSLKRMGTNFISCFRAQTLGVLQLQKRFCWIHSARLWAKLERMVQTFSVSDPANPFNTVNFILISDDFIITRTSCCRTCFIRFFQFCRTTTLSYKPRDL